MKKINPWLILLLNLVTFGIYSLFWTIHRRDEMVGKYKRDIPHWWLLIVPYVTVAIMTVVYMFILLSAYENDKLSTGVAMGSVVIAVAAIATVVIIVWWMWRFLKAAAYVTNNRVPVGWGIALVIFAGPLYELFLQYYFNRAEEPAKLATMPKAGPSRNFMLLAILAILAGICFGSTSSDQLSSYSETNDSTNSADQTDGFYNRYY